MLSILNSKNLEEEVKILYHDLGRNSTPVEVLLSEFEFFMKDERQPFSERYRMYVVRIIIDKIIDVAKIRKSDNLYIPINDFYYHHFGTNAPVFVTKDITVTYDRG